MYFAQGWAQQFHLGALRNNNTRLLRELGRDTGFDSMGDYSQAASLSAFLNALETGYKLVRFDKLDISRAPGSSTEEDGFETLNFAATVSGFAVDDSATFDGARPTSATKTASGASSVGVKGGNQ